MTGYSTYRQIPVLFGALFVASVDNQVLIPLLPVLQQDLGTSIERLGLVFSAYALSAAVLNFFFGPLLDRWGRVRSVRVALVVLALTALGTSRIETYIGLLGLRALAGIAGGMLSAAVAAQIGDTVPYTYRGRAMGLVVSAYFAALVVGIPLSATVADLWSWRVVFLGESLTALLLLYFTGYLVPISPNPSGSYFDPLQLLWKKPQLFHPLLVSFFISGGTLAFLTYIAPYLSQRFGLSARGISGVFAVSGIAAMCASPLSGMWSDRWTRRNVFLAANTALIVPLLLILAAGSWAFVFLLTFLVGILVAIRQTALQTLQSEVLGMEARGTYLAVRNTFSQAGIATAIAVSSLLFAHHGYAGVLGLSATATALGSVLLWCFHPHQEHR